MEWKQRSVKAGPEDLKKFRTAWQASTPLCEFQVLPVEGGGWEVLVTGAGEPNRVRRLRSYAGPPYETASLAKECAEAVQQFQEQGAGWSRCPTTWTRKTCAP